MKNVIMVSLIALIMLGIALPTQAETFNLVKGFNFFTPTAATDVTSQDILTSNQDAKSVFIFDPVTQSFRFHLKISAGNYFGTTITLQDGNGVMVEAAADFTLDIAGSGGTAAVDPFTGLYAGFNFIGLPGKDGTKASALLNAETGLQSIFYWKTDTASFGFLIKISSTQLFGTDFDIADGASYFLNHATGNRVDPAKTLTGVALSTTTAGVATSAVLDLSTITITASWSDSTTSNVTPSSIWSITSGGGTLNGTSWTAPGTAGSTTLQASFTNGAVTQTADLTVTVSAKTLSSITTDVSSSTLAASAVADLTTNITVTAHWSDSSTTDVSSAVTWSIVTGNGTLNGSSFTAPATAGDTVLRGTYTDGGISKSADITITVSAPTKTVQSIALSSSATAVKTTATLDLSTITTTATYTDASTTDVSSSVSWSIKSGEGTITGSIYAATANTGTTLLTASYIDPTTSTAFTADLTVSITDKVLERVELEVTTETVAAYATLSLSNRKMTAYFTEPGRTSTKWFYSGYTWSIASGGGTLTSSTWTAPATAGTAVLRASYTELGQTKTADLTITITQTTPATVTVAATATNPTVTLTALTSTESAIAIVYSRNTTDSTYNFTLQGGTAGAPARSVSPMMAPVSGDTFHPHYRTTLDQERMYELLRSTPGTSGEFPTPDMNRAPSRAPTVDSTLDFWISDSSNQDVQITATCRAISNHAYFFEDNTINTPYTQIPAASWTAMAAAWDNNIYPNVTGAFGHEPRPTDSTGDVDQDERIYILFSHHVNDGGKAGYFDSTHEYTQEQINTFGSSWVGVKSNAKEMFFMWVPEDQDPSWWVNSTMGTLAHEFQHMINYTQQYRINDVSEESWLNEGLSQVAEDVAGYGYATGGLNFVIEPFLAAPQNYSLTHWTFNNGSYGCSYMFVRYLVDQGIAPATLTQSGKFGISNVEGATGKTFEETYQDWITCLYLSNTGRTTETKYNYTTVNVRVPQTNDPTQTGPAMISTQTSPAFTATAGTLKSWGLNFIKITGGTGADATFTATDSGGSNLGMVVIRHGQ